MQAIQAMSREAGPGLAGADRRGVRDAERARRRRRLVRGDRAPAVRRRHRSVSAAGVRRAASAVAHAVRRAARAGGIAALFIFLGQAGTSVRGAYDALVSMGIIAYFIPFLFMFAAMIKLQREPAGPEVMRVPGGKPVAIALASIGFFVTAISIVLACIPPDDEPNKTLAVMKVVGSSLVLVGDWRRRLSARAAASRGRETSHENAGRDRLRSADRCSAPALAVGRAGARCASTTTTPATRRRSASASTASSSSRCRGPAIPRGRSTTPISASTSSRSIDAASGPRALLARLRSIYGEWETTDEAQAMNRTFSESLRFPAPDSPVRIVVKKRDARNVFRDDLDVRPSIRRTCSSSRGRRADAGALIKLHDSGDPATKLDLLILGDGYTAAERGKFERDARRLTRRAVRDVAVQGTPARLQRLGAVPAGGAVRHLAAVAAASTGARRSARPTTRSVPSATS